MIVHNIYVYAPHIKLNHQYYELSSCIGYREQAGQHVLLKNSIKHTIR